MYVSQPSVNVYNNGRNVNDGNDGNDGNDDTGEETGRNLNESNRAFWTYDSDSYFS